MSDIIEFPRRGVYARYCISPGRIGPMAPRLRQDADIPAKAGAPSCLEEHVALQGATIIKLIPSRKPR